MAWRLPIYPIFSKPIRHPVHYVPLMHISSPFPPSRLHSMGDRAFSVAGPTLWNALSLSLHQCTSITTFKPQLKTHFFKIAFPDDL